MNAQQAPTHCHPVNGGQNGKIADAVCLHPSWTASARSQGIAIIAYSILHLSQVCHDIQPDWTAQMSLTFWFPHMIGFRINPEPESILYPLAAAFLCWLSPAQPGYWQQQNYTCRLTCLGWRREGERAYPRGNALQQLRCMQPAHSPVQQGWGLCAWSGCRRQW